MDSPAGELCEYCNQGTGCRIYHVVDSRCKDFNCAYSQMKKVNIMLRPDKCNVVFEKVAEDVFLGNLHPERELTSHAKNQIGFFIKDGFSVVIKPVGRKAKIYLAKKHTSDEVWNKIMDDYTRKVENDSTKLHN